MTPNTLKAMEAAANLGVNRSAKKRRFFVLVALRAQATDYAGRWASS